MERSTFITKVFNLEQAERFQQLLYTKYDKVELVRSPRFDPMGVGTYIFKVTKRA